MISWDKPVQGKQPWYQRLVQQCTAQIHRPLTGTVYYKTAYDADSKFDYQQGVLWNTVSGTVDNTATQRHLNYRATLLGSHIRPARHLSHGLVEPSGRRHR